MNRLDYPLHSNPTMGTTPKEKRCVVIVQDRDENEWPVVVYYFQDEDEVQISDIQALDKNYPDLRYDVIQGMIEFTGIRNVTINFK